MTKADVRRLSLIMNCVPHRIVLVCLALAGVAFSSPVHAQDASPLERVEALDLDTARVGRVTAYFATDDRERAVELATLSEEAASLFDRELGLSFDFGVAALRPEHWFEPIGGIPYAIPWPSVPERLLFVPSSLEEGLLVRGRSSMTERRRVVDFVTLHEYGHLATKEYFYPASERDDIPVSWFNELLPNVFAYAFVASTDPEWAKAGKEMWTRVVESREPSVLSLDWGFMNDLPPDQLVQTYAWYQNLLNLRAAELYEEHGLDFLRMAKKRLAWEEAGGWTTESLLAALEEISPGFEGWSRDLQNGDYLSRVGNVGPATREVTPAAASFDGADYSTAAARVEHGERVAALLGCNSCHAEDYTGVDFGAMIPIVEGLWATNISLTMPDMSDDELERLLREGVHPTREMYLMPSRQSQFLGERDMDALIAYLRTIEPAGEPTPLPPPDFEETVTSRLPDDYWRTTEEGQPRSYHNAAEEATYFAENTVPDLGEEHAQGRLVVQAVCSSCHGAAMDGVGEPAGDIQGALEYDDAEFQRLLRDGVGRDGEPIEINWGQDHTPAGLTNGEIAAAISYTRALATHRWNDAVVIVGARVFDGTSTTDDAAVVVRDGLIESVGSSDHVPASVPRIDGTGATVLPGLIDAHTHTREVDQLERALRFGVTTVLDMFTRPQVDSMLRRVSAERNDVAGILSSGVLATAPGGHGTQSGAEIPTVAGPHDATPFVEQQMRNGADFLKIVLNGQRAMGGMPTLDEPTVRALVTAGKSHDLLVVAHVETHDDARMAVEAGVDGLAHVWRVPGAPEDLVGMIREEGVFVIPTLSVPGGSDADFRRSFLEDPVVQPLLDSAAVELYTPVPVDDLPAAQRAQVEAFMRQLGLDDFSDFLQYHVESVAVLHEAGVTILAGSDPQTAGVVHGIGLLQELELLVRAGLSPAEALSAATSRTADAFGLDDRGRIEAGKRADLVLVEGDPTEDVTALRNILRVWRGGEEFDRVPRGSSKE